MPTPKKSLIIATAALPLLSACQQDPYTPGDTDLSYLKAEMVDMQVKGSSIQSLLTDTGTPLPFDSSMKLERPVARDTTLRWMMYYTQQATEPIKIVKAAQVGLLKPKAFQTEDEYITDPVILTSAWQSENGKYINLSLGLKTGKTDDDKAMQYISLVSDSIVVTDDHHRKWYLTLIHDQADVPQFYNTPIYASIPIADIPSGEEIIIDINTYKGKQRKTFRKE